ncbi:unnamed protein product [Rotaria sp. Silwood1]|nr:unnamed protein product [Rotaria sp. Silwood1]
MIVFHTTDLIFFIIRVSLVSYDISKDVPDTMGFLIPILLFDLIGSIPIIICNIIYVIMRHCIRQLIPKETSLECLWRFGTMTCIRLKCHNDRPQAILLMRVVFIICSFILRFICFVIGASCSAHFKSLCTAYVVIAAIALVLSILAMIAEFIHYFRLWTYNPTDTGNTINRNAVFSTSIKQRIEKTHRHHLGFIHHSLLNDQNADRFRHSRCGNGINCDSRSLRHHLLYHTLEAEHDIDLENLSDDEKKSFIAFYETTTEEALDIAQNGFPYGDATDKKSKDYLHLKQNIFFTRSCKRENASPAKAIICVRLNLGRLVTMRDDGKLLLNDYFGFGDGKCDTIYVKKTGRFYLRMPDQIEKWIVAINADVKVNDNLDGKFYEHCA